MQLVRYSNNGKEKPSFFDAAGQLLDLSQFMTPQPGDVICTGTPPDVGMGMKKNGQSAPVGDVMTLGIQGLGEQRQTVVAFKA